MDANTPMSLLPPSHYEGLAEVIGHTAAEVAAMTVGQVRKHYVRARPPEPDPHRLDPRAMQRWWNIGRCVKEERCTRDAGHDGDCWRAP